ncbi:MAG: ABC transporter ATP-binding protein [Chloroflexi bacterium]|nr:ABC transporter ATP-binding protein [Chloroflexota bacterium]
MYAISTEGLGRQYGERWAVRDLNLQIEQGEVFGLLGPNGAGKTTTMRMLSCLIAPSVGQAAICGLDIARHQTEIRKRIGILTEVPGLYENLSAQRNLDFYAKLYDLSPADSAQQSERYLRLLGLWDRRLDIAGTFSKGMKQKLSIARALLHEPQIVILDEPTSALDPESAKLVRDCVSTLKDEGRTIILCTHNLYEAQSLCDRVAIIKRTLLRVGTPRQLQRSLYGRQVEVRLANFQANLSPDASACDCAGKTINDLAVLVSTLEGVGDVGVVGDRLLVSMLDPDEVTPHVVRALINEGMDIVRVAEVEHTLERAYLDLVAREDNAALPVGAVA